MREELREIIQGTVASGRRLQRDTAKDFRHLGVDPKVAEQMRDGIVPDPIEFVRPIVPITKNLMIRLEADLFVKVTSEPFSEPGSIVVTAKGVLVDFRAETLLRRSPPAHRPGRRHRKDRRTGLLIARPVKPPTAAEIANAGHESAYTDQPALAVRGEQEHPPDRWYDTGTASRKVEQMDSKKELQPEVAARQHLKLVKAQMSEVSMRMVNSGQDPEEMLNEISAKLDRKRNELDAAA